MESPSTSSRAARGDRITGVGHPAMHQRRPQRRQPTARLRSAAACVLTQEMKLAIFGRIIPSLGATAVMQCGWQLA